MQKLLTIYLDREGYRVKGQRSPGHGIVQEHLSEYLQKGWKVKMVSGAGGAGGGAGSIGCGWVVVVLEQEH
jgi:hypothetical protein